MNSLQVLNELRGYGNVQVCPRNRIRIIKQKTPIGIVINTDSDEEPGEHWVSIFIGQDKVPIYFDSFGLPPLHEDIISFLNKNSPNGWIYNKLTLQHPTSTSCGRYCIEFLRNQFSKKTTNHFLNLFTSDLVQNENVLNSSRTRRKY